MPRFEGAGVLQDVAHALQLLADAHQAIEPVGFGRLRPVGVVPT